MKKICYITTVSGTIKSFILPVIEYLTVQGDFDISVICAKDDTLENILPNGVKYFPVAMKRGISFSTITAIKQLKKIFRREKFDYVQYSTPNAAFSASIAAKAINVPNRIYGQWGIRYVGMHGIKRIIFKIIEKRICKNSTGIRAVSQKNLAFAIKERLYSDNMAKVIGNGGTVGVDLREFDITQKENFRTEIQNKYSISKDKFVFGFVGRLNIDKGCIELLQAFKKLHEEGNPIAMYIIGGDESDNKKLNELKIWAKQCPSVIFTGRVPKSETVKYYASFDCYVHPSYREGFGMAIQEAGAMGDAIITTDIPGASEVMEQGKSCILVPAKNTCALYEAMKDMFVHREKAKFLGEQAYIRTSENYERNKMLKNIFNDLITILEGKNGN